MFKPRIDSELLPTDAPNPNRFRRQALLITVLALVAVYILWNTPAFDAIMYPFRLFVTYVHEASHSLAAIITGGEVRGFVVRGDGSGFAITAGGSRLFILPAGYIGAAAFGAGLFYLVNTVRYTRWISVALGVGLVVFSTLFARNGDNGLPTALFIGWLFGVALIGLGWKLPQNLNILILNILAMITSLNGVLDLVLLTRYANITGAGSGGAVIRNDAAAFSAEVAPLIPANVWAFVWAAIALFLLGLSIYYSIIHPIRKGNL